MNPSNERVMRFTSVLTLLAFLALGLFAVWLFAPQQVTDFFGFGRNAPQERIAPIDVLLARNSSFKTGWNLESENRFPEALAAFDEALSSAKSPKEEAQIKFVIASTHKDAGSYVDAVREFKEIVANEQYPAIFRAFAGAEVGLILADFGKFENHDEDAAHTMSPIALEVFNSEPYATFLREGGDDHTLVITKVYDYSITFYPTAVAEMEGSRWYSAQLSDSALGRIHLSSSTIDSYVSTLRERIRLADKDIALRLDSEYEAKYIPIALVGRGDIFWSLWELGLEGPEKADESLRRAVDFYKVRTIRGDAALYAQYIYAIFVAQAYGSARSADIAELLSPFHITNKDISPTMKDIILEAKGPAKTDKQFATRNIIVTSAPEFKTYLLSIGWEESDFVRK